MDSTFDGSGTGCAGDPAVLDAGPRSRGAAAGAMQRLRARFDALTAWYDKRPLALDVTLAGAVTLVGAVLRFVKLGDIPYGVHPDEAQIGTDAFRIIDHGWIGVYSHAALGVPTLNAYIDAPAIWLLGHTAFTLRLPFAIVGIAAVALTYVLVRVAFGRIEAFFASLLLAISYWHIFYSRLAHSSISYPTVLLGVWICIMLGVKTRRWGWFAGGGALMGLGVYAYNVYPIAIVAVAVFAVVMALVHYRKRDDLRWWAGSMGLCFAMALAVALPFVIYISDPDSYYWKHIEDYSHVSVTKSPEYLDADTAGRARIIAGQLRDFAATYAWDSTPDIIDANGIRPTFDPLTLILLGTGLLLLWRHRREPLAIAAVCSILIVPLPAVTQRGSMMREPLGVAPYAMFIAALPLAAVWRGALRADAGPRAAIASGVLAVIAVLAVITVHDYFWTWRKDRLTRFVYHSEITSASSYLRTLPRGEYVYFYSERHPLSLETRQFLAPGVHGEDRSREFSGAGGSIEGIDRSRPVVLVLLGDYLALLPDIEAAYPGGTERIAMRDGKTEFYAYELPPREAALTPSSPASALAPR
jgi:4-amino-4-deoxy-L-arabinose transferase-like glycosyltransferase